jgi:DNA-binding XRE family transcriptional regulator
MAKTSIGKTQAKNKTPRSTPLIISTLKKPHSELHFRVPPRVFKQVEDILMPYLLDPHQLLDELVSNPGSRIKDCPKPAVKLALLRVQNNLTQRQMANMLDTDQGRLSLIELGKSGISEVMAARIKKVFGVDITASECPRPR